MQSSTVAQQAPAHNLNRGWWPMLPEWSRRVLKPVLSELVTRALTDGPQRVRRRNQAVSVLSEDDYRRLTGAKPDFIQYLMNGPGLEGVDLERDPSPMREVDL